MEKKNEIDFHDLLEENDKRCKREQQQDGWDDVTKDDEDECSDGLDPGFSSWADYYNYKYGY